MERKFSHCFTFYPFTLVLGVICPTKTTQINAFFWKITLNENQQQQQHPTTSFKQTSTSTFNKAIAII
jgi:hypothetical protein